MAQKYPGLHTPKGSQQIDMPWPQLDWGNGQALTLGSSSGQLNVYPPGETVWQIITTQSCWYTVDTSPTAQSGTAKSSFLPSGIEPLYVYVPQGMRFAALTTAASGTFVAVPALVTG